MARSPALSARWLSVPAGTMPDRMSDKMPERMPGKI